MVDRFSALAWSLILAAFDQMQFMRASQVLKLRASVGPSQRFSIVSAACNHHYNLLQRMEKGWSGHCWGSQVARQMQSP